MLTNEFLRGFKWGGSAITIAFGLIYFLDSSFDGDMFLISAVVVLGLLHIFSFYWRTRQDGQSEM